MRIDSMIERIFPVAEPVRFSDTSSCGRDRISVTDFAR
jgi:hypothetical protein